MKRWVGEITDQRERHGEFVITLVTDNSARKVIQFRSERRILAVWVSVILTNNARLVSWIPALPNDTGIER